MKPSPATLTPQGTLLVPLRVFIQNVTVRARGPETRSTVCFDGSCLPSRLSVLGTIGVRPSRLSRIIPRSRVSPGRGLGLCRRKRTRRGMRRRSGEQPEIAVVHGFLGRIREYGPGVVDQGQGVAGEGKEVAAGIEKMGEAAILGGDVVHVGGVAEDLEDPVPVAVVVADSRLSRQERVDHRQEVLGGLISRVGLARADREGARPVQIPRAQQLVRSVQPPLRLRSVSSTTAVHGGSHSWKRTRKDTELEIQGVVGEGSFVISYGNN